MCPACHGNPLPNTHLVPAQRPRTDAVARKLLCLRDLMATVTGGTNPFASVFHWPTHKVRSEKSIGRRSARPRSVQRSFRLGFAMRKLLIRLVRRRIQPKGTQGNATIGEAAVLLMESAAAQPEASVSAGTSAPRPVSVCDPRGFSKLAPVSARACRGLSASPLLGYRRDLANSGGDEIGIDQA
jgi:hypothetical protein